MAGDDMTNPMTPSQRRELIEELNQLLEDLGERAVCRDGLSEESYGDLENAESFEELKQVLLDVFEPSGAGSGGSE